MSVRPRLSTRRLAAAGAAAAAVLLALPVAAGAHVGATGETVDGTTTVTFSFDHGCDGAATTGLRVQLPEGATQVVPQESTGWTTAVTGTEVSWTGGLVHDRDPASFVVTMTLADPEGSTVYLPTIQECTGDAEAAWIVKSEDPSVPEASPRITAGTAGPVVATTPPTTRATDDDNGRGSTPGTVPEKTTNDETGGAPAPTTTAGTGSESAAPATEPASSSSSSAPLIIGLIAAVVIIGGLIAFFVTRKGSSTDPA